MKVLHITNLDYLVIAVFVILTAALVSIKFII